MDLPAGPAQGYALESVGLDGRRWPDFEIADRSKTTFLRLCARLPEAALYRNDAFQVYGYRRIGIKWASVVR